MDAVDVDRDDIYTEVDLIEQDITVLLHVAVMESGILCLDIVMSLVQPY